MNRGFCDACGELVPARPVSHGTSVFLAKECPACGPSRVLISADAQRYYAKRSLDAGYAYAGCSLACHTCAHKRQPGFVFVDVTNRCNQNCPICINNTPRMGFTFDPPIQYFDELFRRLARSDPRPTVHLFGGEPTVRDDLLDIIGLARCHGLTVRVVTNGLKLADVDYCRRLVASKCTILLAYDGPAPETYRALRGAADVLETKRAAIRNLQQTGARKVCFMVCVAKGLNDRHMPDLLSFCHDLGGLVRGIYLLPLAQTWAPGQLGFSPERITTEDMELRLNECYPDDRIEFLPAGVLGDLPRLVGCLRAPPLPFMGAHPNCESFYMLLDDGPTYAPVDRFLRGSLPETFRSAARVERRLATIEGRVRHPRHETPDGLARLVLLWAAGASLALLCVRHVRLWRLLKERGITRLWHALQAAVGLVAGHRLSGVLQDHTVLGRPLQIIVLPFEDRSVLETDRLERCPNAFAFYDPVRARVDTIPVCAWGLHQNRVLRRINDFYRRPSVRRPTGEAAPAAPA